MTETMTIERARKIIGDDIGDMTDDQLAEIVAALDAIADMLIECYIDKRRTAVGNCRKKKAA